MSQKPHLPRRAAVLVALITLLLISASLVLVACDNRNPTSGTVAGDQAEQMAGGSGSAVSSDTATRPADGKAVSPQSGTPVRPDRWPVDIPQDIDRRPLPERAAADNARLEQLSLPVHDFFETAQRLGRFELGERVVEHPPSQQGDRQTFSTQDGPRQAELLLVTELGYYWAELGLNIDPTALADAVERVERELYPVLVSGFGQEWRPGVDQDDRFTVLHVLGSPDAYELGYFTDQNQFPRSLFGESNEREMVYLNMARLDVGSELYLGTLIHELQHLAHWNLDANEAIWMNEGLSQLAETVVGLDTVDVMPYLEQPEVRLDAWSYNPPDVYAHYASSYLFLLYLREQAGMTAITELVRHPGNGLAAVQSILDAYQSGTTWRDLFADWIAANYLDDPAAGSKYAYNSLEMNPPSLATRARVLPFTTIRGLNQLGVDYIDLDLSGTVGLTFAGQTFATLVSDPPPGDSLFWYAPPGNSSRSSLVAEADLTGLPAPTLSFDAWYDLEAGWDFAYVSVSVDDGLTWELVTPEPAVAGTYGPALGGLSAQDGTVPGWLPHKVSLSRYAGLPVRIRLDVLSDPEGLSAGLGLANMEIAGLTERGGNLLWQPEGFVETGWLLPQEWLVVVIRRGLSPQVYPLDIDDAGVAQAIIDIGPQGAVLAITPVTPAVRGEAKYWVQVEQREDTAEASP